MVFALLNEDDTCFDSPYSIRYFINTRSTEEKTSKIIHQNKIEKAPKGIVVRFIFCMILKFRILLFKKGLL